jgi:hypothetical protein
MANEQQELISTPILLKIPKDAYDAVANTIKDNGDGAKFQALAQWFINEFAAGGMMIKAANVSYINGLVPGKANSDTDIVKLIQAYAKRQDGQYTFNVPLDPAIVEPSKDAAFAQGCTLEEFIKMGLNVMLTNGWLYSFKPEGELRFTEPQMKLLEGLVGKSALFGSDLIEYLFPEATAPQKKAAEEDPEEVAPAKPEPVKAEAPKKKV